MPGGTSRENRKQEASPFSCTYPPPWTVSRPTRSSPRSFPPVHPGPSLPSPHHQGASWCLASSVSRPEVDAVSQLEEPFQRDHRNGQDARELPPWGRKGQSHTWAEVKCVRRAQTHRQTQGPGRSLVSPPEGK